MVVMTAREFMEKGKVFQIACELAGIPATKRQARRYLNGTGKAWGFKQSAINKIKADEEKARKSATATQERLVETEINKELQKGN